MSHADPLFPACPHDTVSTAPPTSMPTQRSEDGRVTPDSMPDTGSDS
jgi:hypothetical protein